MGAAALIAEIDSKMKEKCIAFLGYLDSDEDGGIRLNRYEREIVGGRGETYHEIYVGLNWFLYGHKLKWQTGIQYTDMDSDETDGIVDGHAYSILQCVNDCAGTDQDLIKMRNPWGSGGELNNGYWADDGPGWDEYPEIKEELNPVVADDGIFWVSKEEFFSYFGTIYLSASDMTEFLTD